jgi:hypothetical protein
VTNHAIRAKSDVQEAFEIKYVKRVVSVDSSNVYVCREDEYNRAQVEKRDPVTMGFHDNLF